MKRFSFLALVAALIVNQPALSRAAELVYFHSEACEVCEQWNEEVGLIYGKTDEAKRLTLRRQSVHDDIPADLSFIKGVVFTPTFVVVEDGREVGRLVGYIRDYFFWEQVDGMIKRLDAVRGTMPVACQESTSLPESALC